MNAALPEAVAVTLIVTSVLDRLGVTHAVVGSLASSFHGVPRSTNDVDIVAALLPEHVAPLVAALDQEFYIDADMIRDALARRSEFNVLHLATMFKVDVFVPRLDGLIRTELARAEDVVVSDDPVRTLRVASAEDVIVRKLVWFRAGGELSDRQWKDVLGILQIRGPTLNVDYIKSSAEALGVGDLLIRLQREV